MSDAIETSNLPEVIEALSARIAQEAELDRDLWGQFGQPLTLVQATDIIKTQYLEPRRVHLFATHSVCDIPGRRRRRRRRTGHGRSRRAVRSRR